MAVTERELPSHPQSRRPAPCRAPFFLLLLSAACAGGCIHPPRQVLAETRPAGAGEPNHYRPDLPAPPGAQARQADASCDATRSRC
jgi:hypothetical protein